MTITIRRVGARFRADISLYDKKGSYHRERKFIPGSTAVEARRIAQGREAYLYENGDLAPEKPVPTLKEFGERFIHEYAEANGQKPSSIAAKKSILQLHLLPVLGGLALDRIGEPEIQRVKLHLGALSEKTKSCVLSVLSGLLNTAHRWGEIASVPQIARIGVAHEEAEFYGFEEYEALIRGAERAGPVVLAAILCGGEAGLRRGEVVALEQADVGGGCITVSRNDWRGQVGTTKGNKTRRIPLTSRLAEAIQAIRHLRGPRLLYFGDHPVSALNLNRWMEQACARAGLPRTQNFHRLRHSFCSHLAMRNAPPTVIKDLAGHASLRQTEKYMHLTRGSKEAAIRLLEAPAARSAEREHAQ